MSWPELLLLWLLFILVSISYSNLILYDMETSGLIKALHGMETGNHANWVTILKQVLNRI